MLGGHVLGRAEHRARRGDPQLALHVGQPEVEDLREDPFVAVEQIDVVGLEVTVDDIQLVGARQRAGDLAGDGHDLRQRHRTVVDDLVERAAHQVLHHQIHLAVIRLAEVGDVDDVLVIDAVGRARLP